MKSIYQVKSGLLQASIKDADVKKGIITGYFSSFDNVDADGDIIKRGAYAKTIAENGPKSAKPRIKHLQNHNVNMPLGLLTDLQEDQKGLFYESQIGTHTLGRDFIKMVESDLITEHSVGIGIIKKNQLQDYEGYKSNPSAGWFELTEVKLWEGSSLTGWGANELTPIVGMKGTADDLSYFANRQKAIEKFCRQTDASDETIELLLIEVKQLTQIICNLKQQATKPELSTLPENEFAEAINKFLNTKN